MSNSQDPALTYSSYLAVDELLTLQRPLSDGPEHDELLFIVIHQTYELWFKQVIHEIQAAQRSLESGNTFYSLGLLGRIRTILKVCVSQIDILETMTEITSARSVWDSTLNYLSCRGYEIPTKYLERDFNVAYQANPEIQEILLRVHRNDPESSMICERLVDIDEGLQEWRYRHVKMVERTIGHKVGTGGSSGVGYLSSTLFHPTFPDLWAIRDRF